MENKNQQQLSEAPMGKLLLRMSVPSTLAIMSYNLYNIVNTIYVSRGIGTYAAGGLSVTFPLFIILSAVSTTMGNGAASVISRALGKGDYEKANYAAANTFLVFWVTALFITVFGLIFLEPLLYLLGVTESLMPYAKDYISIILLGAITSTGFSSIIRAEGNSKFAMYLWIIPVIINIILDPVFIFALKLGVKGAAAATLVSQFFSAAMSMHYFFISGKSFLKIRLRHFWPDIKVMSEVIMIGIPSFMQMTSQSISMIIINNILKVYGGAIAISAYGIVNRIGVFCVIPLSGIVQGFQPIVGYNYGAGKIGRVKEALKISSIVAGTYGALVTIMLLLFPSFIIGIFSTDKAAIGLGIVIIKIANLACAFTGIQNIQAAYFQSIGKSFISLCLSLCNCIIFFIPAVYIMSRLFGLTGVWFSFPLSAVLSLVVSSILTSGSTKKLVNQ